jgi:hypothetical protein
MIEKHVKYAKKCITYGGNTGCEQHNIWKSNLKVNLERQIDEYARNRYTYAGPEMVQYQDKFRDQYSQDTKSNAQLSSKKSQCMNIRSAPNNISFSNAPKPTQRDLSQLTGILATLTVEI